MDASKTGKPVHQPAFFFCSHFHVHTNFMVQVNRRENLAEVEISYKYA